MIEKLREVDSVSTREHMDDAVSGSMEFDRLKTTFEELAGAPIESDRVEKAYLEGHASKIKLYEASGHGLDYVLSCYIYADPSVVDVRCEIKIKPRREGL